MYINLVYISFAIDILSAYDYNKMEFIKKCKGIDMSNPIKKIIFDYQLNKCHKNYAQTTQYLSDPYALWIKENEAGKKRMTLSDDWFVLSLCDGEVVMPTTEYCALFEQDSEVGLIYADEDIMDAECHARYGAWFKPDYSPDTLLSFFYMGSVVFINRQLAKKAYASFAPALSEDVSSKRQKAYDFILYYTEFLEKKNKTIAHIPEVLFHGIGTEYRPEDPKKPEVVNKEAYWGYEAEYDDCKLAALKRRGIHARMKEIVHADTVYHIPEYLPYSEANQAPKVSIVIPSKDNVAVLENCIRSIREKTTYPHYEIVLVDNGSNIENKTKLEKLQKQYEFAYIYEPMPFNFSKMCNMGVAQATGEYILLLNDDMEILQSDWLDVLVGQASVEGVGAVGAKLLYPDSDLIQHVGVSSMWVGPTHKLIKNSDRARDYYYGKNVLPYDMIGVTAACLLVSRDKYMKVGGLCEEIAVSYNDVDFCFALHDYGYRNVIRNDVVLYHHESLSRGDDAMSAEKWQRLLREKDFVYGRHPQIKDGDPYYNKNLSGKKPGYFSDYLYPYEVRNNYNKVSGAKKAISSEWHNNCLTITLEHARLELKMTVEETIDVYWIEGWAYVLNMDNSRYAKSLLLIDEDDKIVEVTFYDRYRPDVVDILPEQTNVALAGFSCRIKREDLHPGEYRVALLYKDRCSRQRLYKECDKKLVVE